MGDTQTAAALRSAEHISSVCLPAHWSSPLIDGSGHVYARRADGKLYKARPEVSSPSFEFMLALPTHFVMALSHVPFCIAGRYPVLMRRRLT